MLSIKEKVAYGLGDAASNIVFQTVMLFLAVYYTDVVGLSAGVVGTIFLGVRIFDALTDPLMGMVADRTNTRWGKFRPFLLWLALPYGVTTVLAFTSFDLSADNKVLYAAGTYALLMTVYTAINIPYSALGGVITRRSCRASDGSELSICDGVDGRIARGDSDGAAQQTTRG